MKSLLIVFVIVMLGSVLVGCKAQIDSDGASIKKTD